MRTVLVNGVELCVDTFGDPGDPALLLIGGGGASMDWWDDEFCRELASGLRFVIRYDSRDTGDSVHYPPGAPAYSAADLIADAIGILDLFDISRAHVIGMSMGGALAQILAIEYPDRLESLTLMSTSPGGDGLPATSAKLKEFYASVSAPDWTNSESVVDYLVAQERAFETPEFFDERRFREFARRVVGRTKNPESAGNYMFIESGEPTRPRLGDVTAPTLVVHGTADPLFAIEHAEALVAEIPQAQLLTLPGVGHQLAPRQLWPTVIPALLHHTSGSWDDHAERLIRRSYAAGDATGWFDRLYAAGAAGEVDLPWDRVDPHPLLAEWARDRDGAGKRAVVVGCGLGADAAFLARTGYRTTGFDIADTAIHIARERHPGVEFVVADLLHLPAEWVAAFDLVVDVFTVQALPDPPRAAAIENIARLLAPGGTLVAIAFRRAEDEPESDGPPFALSAEQIGALAREGLTAVRLDATNDPRRKDNPRWLAEFRRPDAV